VTGGGEAAHVGADLGYDDLSGQVTDARDGPQQADRLAERVEIAVHLRIDLGQGGAKRVELAQVQASREAVPISDAPAERSPQRLRWSLDAALHKGEQRVRSAFAVDQGLHDGSTADAHTLGQHGAELEVGMIERLLQPLHMAGLLAGQLLAAAEQRAQVLGRRFRHEAWADQAVGQQVGEPQRVSDIGLAAGHVLHMRGLGQDQRELAVRKHMPDGFQ